MVPFFSIKEAFAGSGSGALWGQLTDQLQEHRGGKKKKGQHQCRGGSFPGPAGSLGTSQRAESSPCVVPGPRVGFLLCAGKEREHEPCWALPDPPFVFSSLVPSLATPDGGCPEGREGPRPREQGATCSQDFKTSTSVYETSGPLLGALCVVTRVTR